MSDKHDSDSEISIWEKAEGLLDLSSDGSRVKQKNTCKKYKCDYEGCDKAFLRPSKLACHKLLHENKRPFKCKVEGCPKAFTNSAHLKRHTRVSHTQSASYPYVDVFVCTEPGCQMVLKTKQYLTRHLKRKHSKFAFKCPDCDAQFNQKRQLKEHAYIHTGVFPYNCETCNRGFEKNYDLKRHQRGHRTFTCKFQSCTEEFKNFFLYRKHMATAHKPDYSCNVCKKKYSTHGNLRAHILVHHTEQTEEWKCEQCDQKYLSERYLRQHKNYSHQELYRKECSHQDCGKVLHSKRAYVNHMKLHERNQLKGKTKESKKNQSKRKDKGETKVSIAADLSNVKISKQGHKKLVAKESLDTDEGVSDASAVSEIIYRPVSIRYKPVTKQPRKGSTTSTEDGALDLTCRSQTKRNIDTDDSLSDTSFASDASLFAVPKKRSKSGSSVSPLIRPVPFTSF